MALTPATTRDIHTARPTLEGRRVLVTGGTTGIGQAISALLGSYGARVFIIGRHKSELATALAHIRKAGGEADGVVADQAVIENTSKVFSKAVKFLGGLDVLVANAGLGTGGAVETPMAEWRYVLETNLAGYIAYAQVAATHLEAAEGKGQIVLIGSISADAEGEGSPVYAASKGGVRAFAKSLRNELAPKGIRVSLVEPGTVGTDMTEASPADQRRQIKKHEILRAEDVAVAVEYILTQPGRCDVPLLRIEPRLQD